MSAYSNLILGHPNLLSYWRLGESSGSAIDQKGTVNGAYGATGTTRNQLSLIFQDPDASVFLDQTVPGNVNFGNFYNFAGTTPFCIELWIKPTSISASPGYIIDKADSTLNGWWIDAFNGGTRFRRGDGVAFDSKSGPAMINGSINHLVFGYDGSQILPYMNGQAVAPLASTRSIVTSTTSLMIGSDWASSTGFSGYYDELAIYSAPLSSSEVTSHWTLGVVQPPTLKVLRSPYQLA